MKELSPPNTRYIPLVQQKYCCVPACISIVMLKRGISLIPQEVIGGALGLVIEEKEAGKFWNATVGEPRSSGYGTNVGFGEGKVNPNVAFEELKIPLQMEIKTIDEFLNIEDFRMYLASIVEEDKDALMCFDWGTLSGNMEKRWGHVCVLDIVDLDAGMLRLIDPDYFEQKWKTVPIALLYEAMRAHTSENGAGFWELV